MPHHRGLTPSVQRVLVCLCLCGLCVTCLALPVHENVDDSEESEKQMQQLQRILYKYGDSWQNSPNSYIQALISRGNGQRRKRYGIAGLDNVDVITSTLDEQRARKKLRKPSMSVRLPYETIRRMLEAGR